MKTISIALVLAAVATIALVAIPAANAQSANPCQSCHSGLSPTRYQYLDIVEGSAGNVLPSSLAVGQTATVSVVVQDLIQNAAANTNLSGVTLTLGSGSGHFTVSNPTVSIGTLAPGSATATWQITAVSAGPDSLVISASATNTHNSLSFSDTYSPAPTLTITTPTPSTYTVSISVSDSATSAAIAGASVDLNGSVKTTGASGAVSYSVAAGSYTLAISKAGYASSSETISVSGNSALTRTLTATTPPTPTTNTVIVSLTDSATSLPLSGGVVTLGSATQTTGSSGVASFQVASGSHTLAVSKAGYVSTTETITVSGDASLSRALTPAPTQPPSPSTSYNVTLSLIDATSLGPLAGVTIDVNGTTYSTGADGVARFTLPAGSYRVTITRQGYETLNQTITVSGDTSLAQLMYRASTPPSIGDHDSEDDGSRHRDRHRDWTGHHDRDEGHDEGEDD